MVQAPVAAKLKEMAEEMKGHSERRQMMAKTRTTSLVMRAGMGETSEEILWLDSHMVGIVDER